MRMTADEMRRMLAGELYRPIDPTIQAAHAATTAWLARYNAAGAVSAEQRRRLLVERFANVGAGANIRPPFFCDYGSNIELGEREGLAVFTVTYMLAGTLITLWAARIAGRLEEGREQAEDEQRRLLARLHEQAAGLQHEVATRTKELEEANLSLHAAVRINAQLSLVASHTTSGVIIADAQGKIEWVNKAWEHMSGYKLDEVIGRRPGQFLRGPETNSATARRSPSVMRCPGRGQRMTPRRS